jgi:peptidoglycan/xylan/chitin deacetylase (PgdA/CDA1 family)
MKININTRLMLLAAIIVLGAATAVAVVFVYPDHAFKTSTPLPAAQQAGQKPDADKPTIAAPLTPRASVRMPMPLYHYIEYVQDPNDKGRQSLDIRPDLFEKQLADMQKAGYTTLWVKDVPKLLSGEEKLPEKPVVLTFDDGYADFYTDALPLLKKYQAKGTLYIINDLLNTPGYLTNAQVKEIIASGLVEIGAHTLDHKNLKSTPIAEQKRQIFESKAGLEKEFGITMETFAYPYGAYSDQTVALAKEAGFTAAVSVDAGNIDSEKNLFVLPRTRAGALIGNTIGALEKNYPEVGIK